MKKKFICFIVVAACLCVGIMSVYAGTQYTKYACGHTLATGSTGKGPDKTVTSSDKCPNCVAKEKPGYRAGDQAVRSRARDEEPTTKSDKTTKSGK